MPKKRHIRHPQIKPILLGMFVCVICVSTSYAQFLRLGPLDFDSSIELAAIYTTNVELERDSEAKAQQEDIYFLLSLNLLADMDLSPNTDVTIDTGLSIEHHLNRDDLNNTEKPFARGKISTVSEFGRYTLNLDASYERKAESSQGTAFLGEKSNLTRRKSEEYAYGGELDWAIDWFKWDVYYDVKSTRYLSEVDMIGDKDGTKYGFGAEVFVTKDISLSYGYDRTLDELINEPADDPEWKTDQEILANFYLLKKPSFIYSFGYKREDIGSEKGKWEQTHKFSIDDEFDVTKSLRLSYSASYQIEEVEDADDIKFTYGVSAVHEISPTAKQILSLKKEPANTFGSTTDTDSTAYTYSFKKADFLIYDVNFVLDVGYKIDKPLSGGETEKTKTFSVGLDHSKQLSTHFSRELAYLYTWENSNLETESLEEHRVTLTYVYQF